MEIKKVLAHTCFQRKKGMERDTPLSPKKCRCRQYVTVSQAAAEVALGMAQYIVTLDKMIEVEETCAVCAGQDNLKKSCKSCAGAGIVTLSKRVQVRGQDIIRTVSEDGTKNTTTTQVKKSPTIEKAHIERAYVDDRRDEQLRIEEYGALTKDFIQNLVVGFEPVDDPKTGTGRRYDYGRSV